MLQETRVKDIRFQRRVPSPDSSPERDLRSRCQFLFSDVGLEMIRERGLRCRVHGEKHKESQLAEPKDDGTQYQPIQCARVVRGSTMRNKYHHGSSSNGSATWVNNHARDDAVGDPWQEVDGSASVPVNSNRAAMEKIPAVAWSLMMFTAEKRRTSMGCVEGIPWWRWRRWFCRQENDGGVQGGV